MDKKITPTAAKLMENIRKVMADTAGKDNFVHPELVAKLESMRPVDLEALNPPAMSRGFWSDDLGFCKRLAGYLFDASPETINEMPGGLYTVLLSITSQNYINFLARAMSA